MAKKKDEQEKVKCGVAPTDILTRGYAFGASYMMLDG